MLPWHLQVRPMRLQMRARDRITSHLVKQSLSKAQTLAIQFPLSWFGCQNLLWDMMTHLWVSIYLKIQVWSVVSLHQFSRVHWAWCVFCELSVRQPVKGPVDSELQQKTQLCTPAPSIAIKTRKQKPTSRIHFQKTGPKVSILSEANCKGTVFDSILFKEKRNLTRWDVTLQCKPTLITIRMFEVFHTRRPQDRMRLRKELVSTCACGYTETSKLFHCIAELWSKAILSDMESNQRGY